MAFGEPSKLADAAVQRIFAHNPTMPATLEKLLLRYDRSAVLS